MSVLDAHDAARVGPRALPEGSPVISGGYVADLAPGVTVEGNHPAGNGWSVIAFYSSNPGAVTESKLKLYALCLKGTH